MKKTKKLASLILVGTMISAFSFSALADNGINGSNTGETVVRYSVAPTYIVEIPASVTLGATEVTEHVSIHGATVADNVIIPTGRKVNVAITASTNNFAVANDTGSDSLSYSVNGQRTVDGLTSVAVVGGNNKVTEDLTFSGVSGALYADTYTDTLTFTVSLQNE